MLATQKRRAELNSQIIAIVQERLFNLRLSARAVSIDVVGHDGLIRDIKKGNIPTGDRLDALFCKLGVSFSLGESRSSEAESSANRSSENKSPNGDKADLSAMADDIKQIKSALLEGSGQLNINAENGIHQSIDEQQLIKAIRLTDSVLESQLKLLSPDDRASAYSLVYEMLYDNQSPTADNIISLFKIAS